jgi:aminoglycoside 6'-N-acetyltransferase
MPLSVSSPALHWTAAPDCCFADPSVRAVLLDPLASNTRAHRFYERLGFVPVERRTFGADDCIVYRLERDIWQRSRPSQNDD